MLVALKQTIVAILMAVVKLGATQWTKINVGSFVVFLHVKPKVGDFFLKQVPYLAVRNVCFFVTTVIK